MQQIFLGCGKDFLKCPLMDLEPIDLCNPPAAEDQQPGREVVTEA